MGATLQLLTWILWKKNWTFLGVSSCLIGHIFLRTICWRNHRPFIISVSLYYIQHGLIDQGNRSVRICTKPYEILGEHLLFINLVWFDHDPQKVWTLSVNTIQTEKYRMHHGMKLLYFMKFHYLSIQEYVTRKSLYVERIYRDYVQINSEKQSIKKPIVNEYFHQNPTASIILEIMCL